MGDCYSVTMRIKVVRGTKSNLAGHMRRWMRGVGAGTDVSPGVNWAWAYHRAHGARPDSLRGIVKILLAAHQRDFRARVDEEGFDVYSSGFSASYTWGGVMRDAFREMAWALADGSYLYIDRDAGADWLEVKDASAWERDNGAREFMWCSVGAEAGKEPGKRKKAQRRRGNDD